MKTLYTNFIYPTEIQDVAKLFFEEVVFAENECDADICLKETVCGATFRYVATCGEEKYSNEADASTVSSNVQQTRIRKRYAKLCAYNLLVICTGKRMPWGSLTGIRPTKLACQLQSEGFDDWQKVFVDLLKVSHKKTQLVADILATQGDMRKRSPNTADLYVGIPFCITRCSYCSFTSGELERMKKFVEPYVDALCSDVRLTLRFAKERKIEFRNVYFGGGTPTSLTAAQLDKVLSEINFSPVEFTVEAGRPDTVDEEKLRVLRAHGVQRISINPQTFNQNILDGIGRKHTVKDIYDKYEMAKNYGFAVNMDLIAGLPDETFEMFCYSVQCAAQLSPENVTVHTLALKHGSVLKDKDKYVRQDDTGVSAMVEYAHGLLKSAGYVPYYMYRQKYMTENLENVGFCKPNTACLYNIGIMEEVTDILACGTNAISKRIFADENRIERSANAKDVVTYIERNEDYLQKKFKLFS
ncbi:MAG: coproporphyrinogen dehydrogenase HemZ [Corallococcus sp.]|nr:coproporphyrinogen dehydrogenase HemZ [Corallococcus sp.]MCM1359445.1 coproporphyrinogen dehydrogenase HemZ [Corallococcus sp.]MCM1394743.1 coproporphyrinogen dehydrogenase HemZ [Corallococcus sp.]